MRTLIAAAMTAICAVSTLADPVTTNDVMDIVRGWKASGGVLGGSPAGEPSGIEEYAGLGGTGTYYVVSLQGGGFVVASGDTALEPVLAYSAEGVWNGDSAQNPLKAMVEADVAAAATAGVAPSAKVAAKWEKFRKAASAKSGGLRLMAAAPADVRVDLSSKMPWWDQGQVNGHNVYNSCTPKNYASGCVATANGQIMRYWQWPQGGNRPAVGDWYANVSFSEGDRGWNVSEGYYAEYTDTEKTAWDPAFGGPYDWANMPLKPTGSNETENKAIGRLLRDVGMSSYVTYSGSSSAPCAIIHRYVDQFGYANAKWHNGSDWNAVRDSVLASLDAEMPCYYNLPTHAVVADGYGYDSEKTLYLHFNLGWSNTRSVADCWYAPPDLTATGHSAFTRVDGVGYNIYPPTKNAEPDLTVVSGRVLLNSAAQAGVTVTATDRTTGFTTNVTTSAASGIKGAGIYYFMLKPGFYTFAATSGGKAAAVQRQVNGCSSAIAPGAGGSAGSSAPGNVHGLDLELGTAVAAPAVSLAHRWSFAGGYADSAGGSAATPVGSSVTVSGGKAKMTGDGHGTGSLNLGTNLLNTDGATVEIWASQTAVRNWSRVFDYGADDSHYFTLTWTYGTTLLEDRAGAKNTDEMAADRTMAPYRLGVQYHISATFERQGDGSTVVRWMRRDAASGALQRSGTMTMANGIHAIASPRFLLGGSQYAGDKDACAEYDEVRVWNGVLTDAQLKASALAGPDADLSTLPWNAAAPRYVAKAVWKGGTAVPTAATLADSANWECYDQNGDSIAGVPGEKAVVVIPNGTTAFTVPSGYVPAWRKVRLGSDGAAATQWATKDATGGSLAAFMDTAATAYAAQGEGSVDATVGRIIHNPQDVPSALAGREIRYDGWVYVSDAQAGRWRINAFADDYVAFRIDDEWAVSARSCGRSVSECEVSKGWHRFTLVEGDNGGGYGGRNLTGDHGNVVPVAISINGGGEVAFSSANFTFGGASSGTAQLQSAGIRLAAASGSSAVTLAGDCDLSSVEEVSLDAATELDLNGHTLKAKSLSSSSLGATVASSASGGSLVTSDGTADGIVLASGVNVGATPPETYLEYIETDGTAYFDTGVIGKSDTKAETGMMWGAIEGDRGYLGSRPDGGNRCNMIHQFSSQWWFAYRSLTAGSGVNPSAGTYYKVVSEVTSAGKFNLDVNGVHYEKDCPTGSYANGTTMGLFMLTGYNQHSPSGTRCYYLKIWQDGALVRDFRPCLKDGVPALYDAVDRKYYFNAGGGTFKAGPCSALPSGYQLLEYVETDGNSYFDTGVTAKSGTKAETGMMWGNPLPSGDRGFLSARYSDERFLLIHVYNGNWWPGYWGGNSGGSFGSASIGEYNKVVAEVTVNGHLYLDVNGIQRDWDWTSHGAQSLAARNMNLYLFAMNGKSANVASAFASNGTRCYYLKIWQVPDGGTDYVLVRDFMPCKNASGEVGLYDAVNGDFYSKQGSGTLKAGPRSDVPGGYKRIGYLEAYGNSYIDTGVTAKSGTKAETGMMWGNMSNGSGPDRIFLGARHSSGRFMLINIYQSGEWYWWPGYKGQTTSGAFGKAISEEYSRVTAEVTSNGILSLDVNGQNRVWDWSGSERDFSLADQNMTMYLFAQNGTTPNVPSNYSQSGTRCYYLKIWQVPDGGTDYVLVRDFIPCLNSEGVPGLYDAVNNRFYSNKGSGMFRTGPYAALPSGYQRLEYVETDGESYFNTKIVGRSGLKADTGMKWGAVVGGDAGYLCARNGQDNRFMFIHCFNYGWRLGYYTASEHIDSIPSADNYYRVVAELTTNGMFTMDVNGTAYSRDLTQNVGAYNSGLDLFLFVQGGVNGNVDTSRASPAGTRCYYLRIWQGGALVRDFIPCVNDSGVVGLYDAVHAKFYGNDGPGTLRAGPVAFANTYTWHGGASGNLSDVDNWWPPAPMGEFTDEDELVVGSAATITVDAPVAVSRITSNASGATQFSGSGSANVLTLGSIVNSGTGAASFGCPVQFEGVYPYTTVQGAVELASGARLSNGASAAVVVSGAVTATGTGAAMDGAFTFDGGTLAFAGVAPTESDLSARLAFTNASSGFLAGAGAITVDFTARPTRGKVVVCPAGGLTAAAAQAKVTATVNGAPLKGAKVAVIDGKIVLRIPRGVMLIAY